MNALPHDIDQGEQGEIISHLDVVGVDVQAHANRKCKPAAQPFAAVGPYHAEKHRRQRENRPYLAGMPGLVQHHVVGRKSKGQGADKRHPGARAQTRQQNIKQDHSADEIPYRPVKTKLRDALHIGQQVALLRRTDLVCRHPSKHSVRPKGHFAGFLLIQFGFARHRDEVDNVALPDHLAFQLR